MLFRKKPEGRTFLILDVESGSVGGALAHLGEGAPRYFGEMRSDFAVGPARDAHSLRAQAASAIGRVAEELAQVAARLRGHEAARAFGTIERAVLFMGSPWGVPRLDQGKPYMDEPLRAEAERALARHFATPLHAHARASAALHAARATLPYDSTYLLIVPGGEITEIMSIEDGAVASYGTLPVGLHTAVRTLAAHGGLHEHEARALIKLGADTEPLTHAREHIAGQFARLAKNHGWERHTRVYSMSHQGDWLARALSRSSAARLFGEGSTIKHLPQTPLESAAWFVDTHYRPL